MIQPVLQTFKTRSFPTFKNDNKKNTQYFNPIGTSVAQSINTEQDFQKKIVEQNEKMLLLNCMQVMSIFFIMLFAGFKALGASKGSSRAETADLFREFKSLKNDKSVQTLDTCKSMNKDLRDFLRRQLNLVNAGETALSESGEPIVTNRFLLYGPAGVGKSQFAKIYAKSMDAEYKEILYSDLNSQWIGEHLDNVKRVFEDAMNTAKSHPDKKYVLTLNEIDTLVQPVQRLSNSSSRGTYGIFKTEERSEFLNYLELMRNETPNITVIGTTNLSPKNNVLDQAAISRFPMRMKVSYPDAECLYEALKTNLEKIKNKDTFFKQNDKELKNLAQKMFERKFSFRNLEYMVNDAKSRHLDDRLHNNTCEFKFEYLEKAFQSLKDSEGELESSFKKEK